MAALVALPPASAHARDHHRLDGVTSFAFAIGSGDLAGDYRTRLRAYDLLVVDGAETPRSAVAALRADGHVVLAYLSVGTLEPGRSWYARARRYRLDRYEEFGEYYADTSKRGHRDIIAGRVAPTIMRKGFDGLFLDNTDMIEEHTRQRAGMRTLVKALRRVVDRRPGRLLFAQNGDDVIGPSLRYYDGWNREDASFTYDFARRRYGPVGADDHARALRTLAAFRRRGLFTTATDYVAGADAVSTEAARQAACSVGALPFVSSIELTRIPAVPLRC